MIQTSIQEEDTIVNIFVPNLGASKYIRQVVIDTKGKIDSNTIIVGDINTPLTSMDISSRQKINKEQQDLNDTLEQRDLIDIYRESIPSESSRIHILFKCAWNILQDRSHAVPQN